MASTPIGTQIWDGQKVRKLKDGYSMWCVVFIMLRWGDVCRQCSSMNYERDVLFLKSLLPFKPSLLVNFYHLLKQSLMYPNFLQIEKPNTRTTILRPKFVYCCCLHFYCFFFLLLLDSLAPWLWLRVLERGNGRDGGLHPKMLLKLFQNPLLLLPLLLLLLLIPLKQLVL